MFNHLIMNITIDQTQHIQYSQYKYLHDGILIIIEKYLIFRRRTVTFQIQYITEYF